VSKTVIIIPTYNERKNIARLIDDLQIQFQRMDHDWHILAVDNSSPDKTADVVRDKQITYSNLRLLTGNKQGLGAAYKRGMRYAIEEILRRLRN
jgi:dolichol-phosphate mannosyltransferase